MLSSSEALQIPRVRAAFLDSSVLCLAGGAPVPRAPFSCPWSLCSWRHKSLPGVFLGPSCWLSIPQAGYFWTGATIWCRFSSTVVSLVLVCCGAAFSVLSLGRQKVAFTAFPGHFMKMQGGAEGKRLQQPAGVFPSNAAEFSWNSERAQACQMRCVVTLGGPLPQQLKCSMPSRASLDLTSAIFPLTENLAVSIICPYVLSVPHPYTSRPSPLSPDLTFLEAFAESFMIIPVCSIVAEMTNTWIVLLQILINIFKRFFSSNGFYAIVSLNCCLQVKPVTCQGFQKRKKVACIKIFHQSCSFFTSSTFLLGNCLYFSCSWAELTKELWNGFQLLVCSFFHSKYRLNHSPSYG